ncbi:MAG: hypothetical protein KF678_02580 [Phycisphaeraceae bacterium]|nr:hypothetical protein [Phycisphaeraceae bacterium]
MQGHGRISSALLLTAAGLALLPCATSAQSPPPEPAAAAPNAEFATADDLLTALEKADKDIVTLTAETSYDVRFEIQGDRQVRKGKLYFQNKDPRKFAVQFDELWIGDVVRREQQQLIIFDGEWLVEKNFKEKMMIKRQVVPPGQTFDPLKIGEGPLPIPLGQTKADVTLRFKAELQPVRAGLDVEPDASAEEKAEAESLVTHVQGATQIRLTPQPGFERETDFTEIRLWYRRTADGILLPVMARTTSRNMNTSIVQLSNIQVQRVNQATNAKAAIPPELIRIDAPPKGWDFDLQPFRQHIGGGR